MTAIELIARAMRLVGVSALGEPPSADEASNGLISLNAMLSSMANENLMIYADSEDVIPVVPSTSLYTLGPSGTVATTRPVSLLLSSYVIYQGVSYMTPLMTVDQYNAISFKQQAAPFPWSLWYEPTYPDGSLLVYPVPDGNSILHLWSRKPLTEFATLTTPVTLPPGYEDMLAFNLAVNFAPEFDASIPAAVVQRAASTKRLIKRTNTAPKLMSLPAAVLPEVGWVNWRVGA